MTTLDTETSAALAFLRNRRSMTKAKPDAVPEHLIEAVIEAATWAPNHRRTQPWRFVVLRDSARDELGEVFAQSYARAMRQRGEEPSEEGLAKERAKPLRAPVVIAVASVPNPDPRTIEIEEIAATAAGIENMLLAAQALDLGVMWRTGDVAFDPEVRRYLGFPDESTLLAFVYLGYPEIVPPLARLDVPEEFVTWMPPRA